MADVLQATAFRGDPDTEEVHSFFQTERQFAGDTLWSFGTSLKSAYVNCFEFMNHAPVTQLWRDEAGALQAVSRLSLGTGEWFHQASPEYRTNDVTRLIVRQADAALALLSDHASWNTVRYQSQQEEIELLHQLGYTTGDPAEVYMSQSLISRVEDDSVGDSACPPGVQLSELDVSDATKVHERGLAQIDAFSDEEPNAAERAWVGRTMPHQLSFGVPDSEPNIIASDTDGNVLAFADVFLDRTNLIGEFEPVGTRTAAQRTGLAKAVLERGLQIMCDRGMTQAVVRTGCDNGAAIAAYESVGFGTTDLLVRFHKQR